MDHYTDFITKELSNCCGAAIIFPDYCSDCKEHCEAGEGDDFDGPDGDTCGHEGEE